MPQSTEWGSLIHDEVIHQGQGEKGMRDEEIAKSRKHSLIPEFILFTLMLLHPGNLFSL